MKTPTKTAPVKPPTDDRPILEVIHLERPLMVFGQEVHELTFHELTVGDFKIMDSGKGSIELSIILMAKSAGIPVDDMQRMPSREFVRVQRRIEPFLSLQEDQEAEEAEESQATGPNS